MSRLTPFARLLLVLAIAAAVFFVARKFIPGLGGGDSTADTEQTTTPPDNSGGTTTPDNSGTANSGGSTTTGGGVTRPTFNYTAPEPVNGKLRGVVELGATGFNSFVIRMDGQRNWKLEKADYGSSLVYEKLATDADITAGLKNYIAGMLGFGVGAKDVHFVISSGALKVDITKKIIAELRKLGYVANTVTPEQEGKFALQSVLPASFQNSAFVVDIGSGNTKISWMQGGTVQAREAVGAKYSQNNMTDDAAYNEVKSKVSAIPAGQTSTCFIIGGVPFELAKQVRNAKERYTVLKAPGDYKADGDKQRCGLNIYKAIADATGCKTFVFDWDANFTIGFLLNLK